MIKIMLLIEADDERAEQIQQLLEAGASIEPATFMAEFFNLMTWLVTKKQRGDKICAISTERSANGKFNCAELVSPFLERITPKMSNEWKN